LPQDLHVCGLPHVHPPANRCGPECLREGAAALVPACRGSPRQPKSWIAASVKPNGVLTVDEGAVTALLSGKSLLPAGVIDVGECSSAATRWKSAVRMGA